MSSRSRHRLARRGLLSTVVGALVCAVVATPVSAFVSRRTHIVLVPASAPFTVGTSTATCPSGQHVLFGGFENGSAGMRRTANNRWTVYGLNFAVPDIARPPVSLYSMAYCGYGPVASKATSTVEIRYRSGRASGRANGSVSRGNGRRRRRVRDHAGYRRHCHRTRTCRPRPLASFRLPCGRHAHRAYLDRVLRTGPGSETRFAHDRDRGQDQLCASHVSRRPTPRIRRRDRHGPGRHLSANVAGPDQEHMGRHGIRRSGRPPLREIDRARVLLLTEVTASPARVLVSTAVTNGPSPQLRVPRTLPNPALPGRPASRRQSLRCVPARARSRARRSCRRP